MNNTSKQLINLKMKCGLSQLKAYCKPKNSVPLVTGAHTHFSLTLSPIITT